MNKKNELQAVLAELAAPAMKEFDREAETVALTGRLSVLAASTDINLSIRHGETVVEAIRRAGKVAEENACLATIDYNFGRESVKNSAEAEEIIAADRARLSFVTPKAAGHFGFTTEMEHLGKKLSETPLMPALSPSKTGSRLARLRGEV